MLSGTNSGATRSTTNAKHALVLQEAGISYDIPLNPVQVAAVRAERIAQKQKAATAEQLQVQQQRLANLAASSPAVSGASVAPGSPATSVRVTSASSPSVNTAATASSVVMNTISSTSSPNSQHTLLLQGSGSATLQGSQVN